MYIMSYKRSSINDYPEHLNPFYEGPQKSKFWKFGKVKRSSSFGEAIRNTLFFKSARGKKKNRQEVPSSPPQLRRNDPTTEIHYRQTLPTIVSPSPSPSRVSVPVLLPRSRFSERVAKSKAQQESASNENLAWLKSFEKEVPNDDTVRKKRRKRRAPLPPHGLSNSSTHTSSQWSLTSDATDITAYSDNENTSTHVIDPSVAINIHNIVKEIEKLADEDNDGKANSTDTELNDVPDVVSSSRECKDFLQPTDENCNVVPETCDKDAVEDNGPDVLHCHSSLDENEKNASDTDEPKDSLAVLINSIELNNNDDNKLEGLEDKADSLTNIINSINMIENECYEPPLANGIDQPKESEVVDEGSLSSTAEDANCNKLETKKTNENPVSTLAVI